MKNLKLLFNRLEGKNSLARRLSDCALGFFSGKHHLFAFGNPANSQLLCFQR